MDQGNVFDLSTYERKEVKKGPEIRRQEPPRRRQVKRNTISTDSDVTIFCKRIALIAKDKDTFRDILDFIQFVGEYKLTKQCNIAFRKTDEYWANVEQYIDITDEEVYEDAMRYSTYRDENTVSAISTVLWNEGLGTFRMGVDIRNSINNVGSVIRNAFDDLDKLVADVVALKYRTIKPAVDAILDCVQSNVTRNLVGDDARREYVFELVNRFIDGEEFNFKIDTKRITSLTQPGIALPHTLAAKDWLMEVVAKFLKVEFGTGLMVMVRSKGVADVRQYSHERDSHFVFSEDPDSALHYGVSPALYCTEVETAEDGSPIWRWRALQKVVTSMVNAECLSTGEVSANARENTRKRILREFADKLKDESDRELEEIRWFEDEPYLAKLGDGWVKAFKAAWAVRLWKRGYSKPQELVDHPEYLHVVSINNANTMQGQGFFLVQLGDQSSVLAIPYELWEKSRFVQSNGSGPYASAYGIEKSPGVSNPYALFYLFYSLACTKTMLENWSKGETFDGSAFYEKFITNVKRSGSYAQLLKIGSSNKEEKLKAVRTILKPFPGPVVGLVIAPESTRFGKNAASVFTKNAGYDRHLASYETVDYGDSDYFMGSIERKRDRQDKEEVVKAEGEGFDQVDDYDVSE